MTKSGLTYVIHFCYDSIQWDAKFYELVNFFYKNGNFEARSVENLITSLTMTFICFVLKNNTNQP